MRGAGAGPIYIFFYCRGRAGIKNFEMTEVGPGLEKLKMPGPGQSRDRNFLLWPGRDLIFFYCRGRDFFIDGAGSGPGSEFFLLPGLGRD